MAKGKKTGGGLRTGSRNKATANARESIARLVDDNAERMHSWLDQIAEDQGAFAAWKCMMDVIEYHIPKLQRTTITGDPDAPMITRVEVTLVNATRPVS